MSEANDFLVDGIYTFEIGGKRKRYSPIEGIPDGFIVADDIKIRSRYGCWGSCIKEEREE